MDGMTTRLSTKERILEAARSLFNARGYAATSLSEIATSIGISQGNLTYHYPSKSDLVVHLQAAAQETAKARRDNKSPGDVSDDYIEHLLFAMSLTWDHRFLLRDRVHFADKLGSANAEFEADYDELYALLRRIEDADMFRRDAVQDLPTLARAIWVMSRYWIDYLRDFEQRDEIGWADQERGITHHLALLLPCLTADAKRDFQAALKRTQANVDALPADA